MEKLTTIEYLWAKFQEHVLGRSDIWLDASIYMRRWRLVHIRSFGARIHNIMRSDLDRELHDHPFDFVSIILWGGYFEYTPPNKTTWSGQESLTKKWYGPGSIIRRHAEDLHRLELKKEYEDCNNLGPPGHIPRSRERSAWTLVFRGPMRRMWGFVGLDGKWIPNKEFTGRGGSKLEFDT